MNYLFSFLCFVSVLSAQTFQSVIQKLEQTALEKRQALIERYLNTKSVSPIIENDTVVHFVLYGEADTVLVNGNLQNWLEPHMLTKIPCGRYSLFYRTFVVPSDARLDYKYIIDGKEKLDPQNPNITPSGYGPHSELRMPGFVSSPYLIPRPGISRGSIDSLAPSINYTAPLKHYITVPRPIKVYRPTGYDTLSLLPVIYIHDGFEAINFAHVPTILDNLIAENRIPPIIAVFIPPVDRMAEYIGDKRQQYLKYLCDNIVPTIDALYRTDRSPHSRAMAGISAGGTISLSAILYRPDVFLNAASQSGTVLPDIRETTIDRFAANSAPAGTKIYLDCGRYDIIYDGIEFYKINREYSDLLSSLHVPHYYKEVNDGHEWASWRERIPDLLTYFFGGRK